MTPAQLKVVSALEQTEAAFDALPPDDMADLARHVDSVMARLNVRASVDAFGATAAKGDALIEQGFAGVVDLVKSLMITEGLNAPIELIHRIDPTGANLDTLAPEDSPLVAAGAIAGLAFAYTAAGRQLLEDAGA